MASYVFHGGRFLDPRKGELLDGVEVLIEGDRVKEVSDRPIASSQAVRINLGDRTLMPGLIDAHVHTFLSEVNLHNLDDVPLTLLTARAIAAMRSMLMRGFTTLRDMSGADYGIKAAVQSGIVDGPRLFIAGMAITQTGGHADFRRKTQERFESAYASGTAFSGRIADGVPEVIHAAREELRKGADFVKIMVSGGVASQTDPLESVQYRADEIEAACQEAKRWGTYVAAHAYSAEAIIHGVSAGVRTIEHGNLINAEAARLMAERHAVLVPTLVAYDAMRRRGKEYGLSDYSLAKNEIVLKAGLRSLELARSAGVPVGFGSDLLGQLQNDQCQEFLICREVMSAPEVLRSATIVNARILNREGELGELVPGACADVLVVDGDPLKDLGLFADGGPNLSVIMKGGRFYKNRLATS
ncbi:MAG TPA: amidohydrolase family protein [Candidatus Sulfotelmatobacter sp.]|nr:amidohydrolase family protein [Candidatus Sulfotelmatobacter sp.]